MTMAKGKNNSKFKHLEVFDNVSTEQFVSDWDLDEKYSNIKPIKKQIVVRQDRVKSVTTSGIIVTTDYRSHKRPQVGTVLAVADECNIIKKGDRVFFSMYAGKNMHTDKGSLICMKEREVMGVLDENDVIDVGDTKDYNELINMVEQKSQ